MRLEVGELEVEERRLGAELGVLFGLDADTPATHITRLLLMDGEPGARMLDVVNPDVPLPPPARLRRALERGQMVLDILLKQGVPVAYNRSHIRACVLTGRDRVGRALGVGKATAALEIEHVTCTAARRSSTRRTSSYRAASICTSFAG